MADTTSALVHPDLDGWLSAHGATPTDLARWAGIAEARLAAAWRESHAHLLAPGCCRQLEEMTLLHVPASLATLAPFLVGARDGSGTWTGGPSLVLFHYLDSAAARRHQHSDPMLCEFLLPDASVGTGIAAMSEAGTVTLERADPGIARVAISARSVPPTQRSELLGALFAELLTHSRPVSRYRATLLLELDYELAKGGPHHSPWPNVHPTAQRWIDGDPTADARARRSTRALTGQVQERYRARARPMLIDAGNLSEAEQDEYGIREWITRPRHGTRWQLVAETRRPENDSGGFIVEPVVADVTGVRLVWRPRYGTALLAVDLESTMGRRGSLPADAADHDEWWSPLVFGSRSEFAQARARQLSRWFRFTSDVRRLRDGYADDTVEDRLYLRTVIDTTMDTGSGAHLATGPSYRALESLAGKLLLRPVNGEFGDALFTDAALREHSRLFTHVSYVLAGPALRQTRLRRLTASAAFVGNPAGPDQTGDAPAMPGAPNRWSFERWADGGALAAFTGECNAYLACHRAVGERHLSELLPLFERTLAYALSLHAILRQFLRRLAAVSDTAGDGSGPPPAGAAATRRIGTLAEIQHDFERFTLHEWCPALSDRPVERDIGLLQQRGLDIDKLYEEVVAELARQGAETGPTF